MSAMSSRSLVAITLCCKDATSKQIRSFDHSSTINSIYRFVHEPCNEHQQFKAKCSTTLENSSQFEIGAEMTLGDLFSFGYIRSLTFECQQPQQDCAPEEKTTTTPRVLDAFSLLMSGQKVSMKKKAECKHRKDELHNALVDYMTERGLRFHKSTVDDEGNYVIQVITNTLWYLTNQHATINDAAKLNRDVRPVPYTFDKFQGYNDIKRKKLKSQPLDTVQCNSHSNALFSLASRAVFHSSSEWRQFKTDIESLAECISLYKDYLQKKLRDQNKRQNELNPARTVGSDISVDFRQRSTQVLEQYKLFDQEVNKTDIFKPVLFDESLHLILPFDSSSQKYRFFKNLHLSVDIDLFTYCPGGGISSLVFVAKVPENRSANDLQTQPIRVLSQIHDQLPVYHTRAMKRNFKEKLSLIASVKPHIIDFVYKELALDASSASNPIMQQRIKMISLGETGLVADLRELNTGRPSDRFDVFFEKLEQTVESVSAADERRHGACHLSHWISLDDMISQTAAACPENTLIPSKSLVRLQFTPRNAYTHSALNFTSRIPVQYKVQRRQLRVMHPDQHYCAAQFKYFKSKAVELGSDAIMLCCDDKAKIPVGNSGMPVSTGVRGKKTLAPVSETLVACDHDMTKSSLCPSVYLECEIPKEVQCHSFVRGKVHVVVNDAVMQTSSPFRHATVTCKVLSSHDPLPKIFMKFSDGGTDQRNTLESVKCASICTFKEMNLDMLILARCAPGHSWTNPAERVMSILNLGLQNCALERAEDDGKFKSYNSMSQIRQVIAKKPELKAVWESSVSPVQKVIGERFKRLKLKDEPFQIIDPIAEMEIDQLQRHLRELFPDMDLTKLQKVHTKKVQSYQQWLEKHCLQRHYTFQIRKCDDEECCIPPSVDKHHLDWLPDPVLDGDHFKPYDAVKGQTTSEQDRPTYQKVSEGAGKKSDKAKGNLKSTTLLTIESEVESGPVESAVYTAQSARTTIDCVECRKPRIVYSKHKLTDRQLTRLACKLSEEDYTCGAFITVPTDRLHGTAHVRPGLSCTDIVELAYYSSDVGRKDICCYCGSTEADIDQELKKRFKSVLPICKDCLTIKRFKPVCQRPFGK